MGRLTQLPNINLNAISIVFGEYRTNEKFVILFGDKSAKRKSLWAFRKFRCDALVQLRRQVTNFEFAIITANIR